MTARRLIGGASFAPDVLHIVYEAYDDAWSQLAPDVGLDPSAIESARQSLANIILSLANAGLVDRSGLKTAAMDAFRLKHRLSS